jgi:hypothetical protein
MKYRILDNNIFNFNKIGCIISIGLLEIIIINIKKYK